MGLLSSWWRRVHGHADGLGRSNRGELRSHRGAHADQKSGRGAAEGPSCDHHRGGHEAGVPSPGGAGQRVLRRRLRVQEGVQGADGFLGHREAGDQGPRLLRRAHHPQPDILNQINGRKHAATQVAPNLAYSDPEMAEIALRNIERRAKHKV